MASQKSNNIRLYSILCNFVNKNYSLVTLGNNLLFFDKKRCQKMAKKT